MKSIPALLLLLAFMPGMKGQSLKGMIDQTGIPAPTSHYLEEYTLDSPSDPGTWDDLDPGLHAGFGSTDERYLRCEIPEGTMGKRIWEGTGWRGERLNTQLLIWSADSVAQVRLSCSDLIHSSGEQIPKAQIRLYLVRYVLSNYPYEAEGFSCNVKHDSLWLMPDRLERFQRFELPGNTVRPVWISVDIPPNSLTGMYKGSLIVESEGSSDTLDLSVRVQSPRLPLPQEWSFRLDLWQNPWVVSKYYQVEPWSEDHLMLLRKHLRPYSNAGGTYITTYAVHSPWSDNSYTLEGGMIGWTKMTEGGWKFDYTVFDTYVRLCMEIGIDEAITVYTPVPWGYRFSYLDEKTGNIIQEVWEPSSPLFRANWTAFLTDLKDHLIQNGWYEKTYLGINENPLEVTLAAIQVIRDHSPDWKITYAGDWHGELSPWLDDYSPVITSEPLPEELRWRSDNGLTTTYYVCCTPPKPNNFVFSAPVEGRFQGWYAASYGYDGFLRWALDAWPVDPNRDARHVYWAAGDCFLIYPGGNSSIRFEKLREGIVDYEKIRILLELASRSHKEHVIDLKEELEQLLSAMSAERVNHRRNLKKETLSGWIVQGSRIIQELSEILEE